MIKCKAWDSTHKQWVDYGFCLRFDQAGNAEILNAFAQPFTDRELVPVLSTGIKDKKGVEVYEGDIVRFFSPAEYGLASFESIEHIQWNEDVAGFELGIISNRLTIDHEIEVIGNVFEHPELLQRKPETP